MNKEELRERINLGPEVFYSVLEKLAEEKKLEVAGELRPTCPAAAWVMKDEEELNPRRSSSRHLLPPAESSVAERSAGRPEAGQNPRSEDCHSAFARQSPDQDLRGAGLSPERAHGASPQDRRAEKLVRRKSNRRPLQRHDRSQPQVCHPTTRISGSRTSNAASRRRGA